MDGSEIVEVLNQYNAFQDEVAGEVTQASEWLRSWVVANLLILEREVTEALLLMLANGYEWVVAPLTEEG